MALIVGVFMASSVSGVRAAEVVTGDTVPGAALVISPDLSQSFPYGSGSSPTEFIERMPVTKLIASVKLGAFAASTACTATLSIAQLSTADLNSSGATSLGVSAPAVVPIQLANVAFSFASPVLLVKGHAYEFALYSSTCGLVTAETGPGQPSVDSPAGVTCTRIMTDANGVSSRFWHVQGHADGGGVWASGSAYCAGTSYPSFDPSMPTGWLEVQLQSNFVNWIQNAPPTPRCADEHGVTDPTSAVYWRPDNPYSDWVCQWQQFNPPGVQTSGWHYSVPWGGSSTSNGAPATDFFLSLSYAPQTTDLLGTDNPAMPNLCHCPSGDPVEAATGNFSERYTDLSVGGLGPGLVLSRTYNALTARNAASPGLFGYGWSSSYGASLSVDQGSGVVTVHQGNGSTAVFIPDGSGGYSAPGLVQATLSSNPDGSYTFTLPDHTAMVFSTAGVLQSVADRNGETDTLSYDASGQLSAVTDTAGRQLTFSHNTDGTVSQVTDPAGKKVSYGYTSGTLTSVTDVALGVTKYGYDAWRRMTSITDPRNHVVLTNTYDGQDRVLTQTDALNRTTTWSYAADQTTITDPAGNVTHEKFQDDLPVAITRGKGTSSEATTTIAYDVDFNPTSVTDPNGHVWSYGYDGAGNRTSVTDPLSHETKYEYDSARNVTKVTLPSGLATSLGYDAHNNLTSITRTLTETGQQPVTTLGYDPLGELTSVKDPLNRTWSYGYDSEGDQTSITSPAGHESTSAYDVDGLLTSL